MVTCPRMVAPMIKRQTSLELLKYADKTTTYHAADIIFKEGEKGSTMYVIKSGTVELTTGNSSVEVLSEGHIFGEMALVDNDPRCATAIARTDCQVVPLDVEKFKYMVRHSPHFAIEVMQVLTVRLRRMNRQTVVLSKRND
jgi:CRP/FNR family transcriptional regulator, cyclic AMP receptor protein